MWQRPKEQEHLRSSDRVPPFQPVPPDKPPVIAGKETDKDASRREKFSEWVVARNPDKVTPESQRKVLDHDHDLPDHDVNSGNSVAMPAFEQNFDWILRKAGSLLEEINFGILEFNQTADSERYQKAKAAYEQFLACLDNPHPYNDQKHPKEQGRCNGVLMKWASIEPDFGANGLVVGAKVVVKWNGGTHWSSCSYP